VFVCFAFSEPVKALASSIDAYVRVCKRKVLLFSPPRKHPAGVKSERGKSRVKPDKVVVPFKVTEAFRDVLREKVKAEGRDVSKLVRMLLRERYPDLPEE
jgi:hypothetical protein